MPVLYRSILAISNMTKNARNASFMVISHHKYQVKVELLLVNDKVKMS